MLDLLDKSGRDGMRAAGKFNAQLMDQVRLIVLPGVSTNEIDKFVHDYTVDHGHQLACLGYQGASGMPFPKSCCTSVNSVVCHGVPDDYILREGDTVNVDLTSIVDGWHGDSSETFLIGDVEDETKRLVECALECLHAGIQAIRPFGPIGAIGRAVTKIANAQGFSVVRDFQGHGIGRRFHQPPGIPHFPDHGDAARLLEPNTCFTIEPMLNAGSYNCEIDVLGDGWTVTTADGALSAQFEHTVLLTEEGPEILTLTQDGPQP